MTDRSATTYIARLHSAIATKQTAALVGLDPHRHLLPASVREAASSEAAAAETFCRTVIDIVADRVPAVKPQAAFFEQFGPDGVAALQRVMRHAREAGLLVVLDAKRGDIGSTAKAYAAGLLAGHDADAAPLPADALTVSPYLGPDTLEPFVERAREVGGGLYVLVRTSNPESAAFQDARLASDEGEQPLYRSIGRRLDRWNAELPDAERSRGYGSIGAVIGATYPAELAELRAAMPATPLLIPGYGSQGGGADDVAAAFDAAGYGALINSSRGILFAATKEPYASQFGPDRWPEAVSAATDAMIADLAAVSALSRD